MKILKNCIKLSCQVKIFVPSTVDVIVDFDSSEWIDKALCLLSEEFGGATASNALGVWQTMQGNLIKEKVTIVFSFARQEQLNDSIEKIHNFCLEMKKSLSQESVALEVNGELYLI